MKIRVDDFYLEVSKTRNRLTPCLKDAKRRGHRAFLKKEKFKIIYKLAWLLKNKQLNE